MSKTIPSDHEGMPAGILGLNILNAEEVMHEGLYAAAVTFEVVRPEGYEGAEHLKYFDFGTTEDPGTMKDGVSDKTWRTTIAPFKSLCQAAGVKCDGTITKILTSLVEQSVVAHLPAPDHIAKYEVPGDQEFMVSFENDAPEPEPAPAPAPAPRRIGRPPKVQPAAPSAEPPAPPAPPRPPASTPVPKRFGGK